MRHCDQSFPIGQPGEGRLPVLSWVERKRKENRPLLTLGCIRHTSPFQSILAKDRAKDVAVLKLAVHGVDRKRNGKRDWDAPRYPENWTSHLAKKHPPPQKTRHLKGKRGSRQSS